MFSVELTTNPWMFYELFLPAPDWYEASMLGWRGKSVQYRSLACFFVGWFGAVIATDEIRIYCQGRDRRWMLAMGAHSRLGAGSQLRTLDLNVLRMIARLL